MHKRVFFWAALSWTGVILFFCLIKASKLPVVRIPNLDKFIHAFFHFVFTSLWFLFFRKQIKNATLSKPIIISFLLSFGFGILIEIIQELFTTSRKADIFDVMANTTGAVFAVIVIYMYKRFYSLNKI